MKHTKLVSSALPKSATSIRAPDYLPGLLGLIQWLHDQFKGIVY